jgi:hypothetical protein
VRIWKIPKHPSSKLPFHTGEGEIAGGECAHQHSKTYPAMDYAELNFTKKINLLTKTPKKHSIFRCDD